jgi:hypothetical protein
MITLYLTPVFYIYMERLQGWVRRRKKAKPVETEPIEGEVLEPQLQSRRQASEPRTAMPASAD